MKPVGDRNRHDRTRAPIVFFFSSRSMPTASGRGGRADRGRGFLDASGALSFFFGRPSGSGRPGPPAGSEVSRGKSRKSGLKSSSRKGVQVRVLSPAPHRMYQFNRCGWSHPNRLRDKQRCGSKSTSLALSEPSSRTHASSCGTAWRRRRRHYQR